MCRYVNGLLIFKREHNSHGNQSSQETKFFYGQSDETTAASDFCTVVWGEIDHWDEFDQVDINITIVYFKLED